MKKIEPNKQGNGLFLGIDGGQSHTEAVIADSHGNILGRGAGGASNHAEIPGGRKRLQNAIKDSVGNALKFAGCSPLGETVFASAHCGMTGGAIYKEEIIGALLRAEKLTVGHDAPTALFGATAGKPGIVVIAGTGSVVFGINQTGETARAGGLGYLFSDEGSGFWLAAQTIRLAIKEQDGLIRSSGILELVLEYFDRRRIHELTDDFYNGKISRDEIAGLAEHVQNAARRGNKTLHEQIACGAEILAASVRSVAEKLNFQTDFPVSAVGGMFRGELMIRSFKTALAEKVPLANAIKPRFGAAIGAVLLAYRQAGIEVTKDLLGNLEKAVKSND